VVALLMSLTSTVSVESLFFRLRNESDRFFFLSQAGDDHLLNLASSYAVELGAPYQEVLQQLGDIRMAEWGEAAPPPPSAPLPNGNNANANPGRNYVNCVPPQLPQPRVPAALSEMAYRQRRESNYVPGQYQVSDEEIMRSWLIVAFFLPQPSSCLSDVEGDQIYDYAAKYRNQIRQHQAARILMSPQT